MFCVDTFALYKTIVYNCFEPLPEVRGGGGGTCLFYAYREINYTCLR
jgi:hypothetical protein